MVMALQDRATAKSCWLDGTPAPPLNEEKIAQNLVDTLPGTFGFNEFTGEHMVLKDLPWGASTAPYPVSDAVIRTIQRGIQAFGIGTIWEKSSHALVERAVLMACESNRYDSLKDWFKVLVWEGRPRLDKFFVDQFGCTNELRTWTLTRIFFLQGVIRALYPGPGCKADVMLVLQGVEGLYKSSTFRDLCPYPDMYGPDIPHPYGSKDCKEYVRGRFIIEDSEMHTFRKSQVEAMQQFLSIEKDTFRASYGHFTETHWRRFVPVGSSNLQEMVAQNGRRLGILHCAHAARIDEIPGLRAQLWAEAVVLYREEYLAKGRPIVSKEEEDIYVEGNAAYVVQSGYYDQIEKWKREVGDRVFTLSHFWTFLTVSSLKTSNRDVVDLAHSRKELVAALRNQGFETKQVYLEGTVDDTDSTKKKRMWLWRLKSAWKDGSVDLTKETYQSVI